MTEAQRHQILLDLLAQTGFVTVEQVISRLGISPATARRDINKLDESGRLKKVRNGAEAISEQRPALVANEYSPGAKTTMRRYGLRVRLRSWSTLAKASSLTAALPHSFLGRSCAANRYRSSPTICRWPTI
ncbi:Ascorbate utilization transcriptional regulator UlaR [Klebsiella michiganensis]|uniref:Ascorbate utilization transcriptional regulator UlaR n=1 Tax=Klebsiella michiganensis TaxID=1134687 RepID=A0A7H4PQW5_9ENTR|nr:Ascorbate utilization transcriptional regulator UlaR [Klebsiella michiganensis]